MGVALLQVTLHCLSSAAGLVWLWRAKAVRNRPTVSTNGGPKKLTWYCVSTLSKYLPGAPTMLPCQSIKSRYYRLPYMKINGKFVKGSVPRLDKKNFTFSLFKCLGSISECVTAPLSLVSGSP